MKDYGFIWLSHLADTDIINGLAKEDHSSQVHLPLGTNDFNFMCQFLAGRVETLPPTVFEDLNKTLEETYKFTSEHERTQVTTSEKKKNEINKNEKWKK